MTSIIAPFINFDEPIIWTKVREEEPCYGLIRATPGSAGLDIRASQATKICPGERIKVYTNLAALIPMGVVGYLHSRSGYYFKQGLLAECFYIPSTNSYVAAIDSDYRGEFAVCMHNTGDAVFEVTPGIAIGQVILQPIIVAPVKQYVGNFQEFAQQYATTRGAGGLGSTSGRDPVVY